MSELNDKELFDQAIADTPAETPEPQAGTPEPEAKADETPRDEMGRFAPKSTPIPSDSTIPQTSEAPKEQPDNAANVPSWRLREVNEAREAAERRATENDQRARQFEQQLAEMRGQLQQQNQKPQEPVEWFSDPNAAFKQNITPLETQIQGLGSNLNLKVSRVLAVVEHGKEAVAEMEKAVEEQMRAGNPAMRTLAAQMNNADDPVGVAMQWHQREKLVKETGGDLTSYKSRMQDDLLKDPAFLAKALEAAKAQASGSKPNTLVQIPPSINRATSAASPHDDPGDLSDASLYAAATR